MELKRKVHFMLFITMTLSIPGECFSGHDYKLACPQLSPRPDCRLQDLRVPQFYDVTKMPTRQKVLSNLYYQGSVANGVIIFYILVTTHNCFIQLEMLES